MKGKPKTGIRGTSKRREFHPIKTLMKKVGEFKDAFTGAYVKKQGRRKARFDSRKAAWDSKQAARHSKLLANAEKGGRKGARARNILEKQAHSQAVRDIEAQKPGVFKEENLSRIKADADVKKIKAKGTAGAAIASALSAGYARGKVADQKSAEARAKADELATQALTADVGSIPDVVNFGDESSVAGLVTGVR